FIGMNKLAASGVGRTSAHGVKLAVSREKNTHHAGSDSWHTSSCRPTARIRTDHSYNVGSLCAGLVLPTDRSISLLRLLRILFLGEKRHSDREQGKHTRG